MAGVSARALIVTRFIVLWLMEGASTALGRTADLRAATHLDSRRSDHQQTLSRSRNVQSTETQRTFSQRDSAAQILESREM